MTIAPDPIAAALAVLAAAVEQICDQLPEHERAEVTAAMIAGDAERLGRVLVRLQAAADAKANDAYNAEMAAAMNAAEARRRGVKLKVVPKPKAKL